MATLTDADDQNTQVTNDGDAEQVAAATNPYDDMREAIADKRDAELNGESETAETTAEAADVEADPVVEAEQEASDALDADAQVDAADTLLEIPDDARIETKIDGEVQVVTGRQLKAGFQKEAVASLRLEKATKTMREAEDAKKEADALLNKAKAGEVETPDSDNKTDDSVKASAQTIISSLLDGEEDAATEALAGLLEGRTESSTQSPAQIDNTEIASQVKQQIDLDSALDTFATDNADILDDPHLAGMVQTNLQAELNSGNHGNDYMSALGAAGQATRDWMESKGFGQASDNTTTAETNRRVANKQSMEQVSTATASAATAEDAPETASDVVAQMKADRGFIA